MMGTESSAIMTHLFRVRLTSWTLGLDRLFDWTLLAVVAAVAAVVVVVAGPVLLGSQSYVVLGGSMEPAIGVGSAVIVRPVQPARLVAGDVITYVTRDDTPVTHRILEVEEDELGLAFRTQGDANQTPDPELVRAANVQGRVWYSVPLAGYVLYYKHHPGARIGAMAVGLLVLLSSVWNSRGGQDRTRPSGA